MKETNRVIDRRPVDLLLGVFLLLQLEYVLVEVELKVLVGVIDAQLLEAVLREVLEAEYIEYRDGGRLFRPFVDDVIDTSDQPGEQGTVQSLGERVPCVQSLVDIQRRENSLVSCFLRTRKHSRSFSNRTERQLAFKADLLSFWS